MSKTLWFRSALLETGWVADVRFTIAGGLIERIETGVAATGSDERHGAAVAGLPNVHSHTFQRAIAGLTERRGPVTDNFWTWREAMYGAVAKLTPEDVEAIAAQAFAEMLESGFTHVGEFHYVHRDRDGRAYSDIAEMSHRIAAAARDTGIGLTMLPCFYAHSQFGGAKPLPHQNRFITNLDEFAKLVEACRANVATLEGAHLGIAPHSLRAVTLDELKVVTEIAGDAPLHIHVAEQTREVDDCRAAHGGRPVEVLLANAPVDERWCLIHATHTTTGELAAIAARKAVIGLCPLTEANLGDGFIDAREYLSRGGRIAIGSDSNVIVDAAQELRMMEYAQRLSRRERNVISLEEGASCGENAFVRVLNGGRQALGLEKSGLVEGGHADIVALKFPDGVDHPAALLDRVIFGARERMIDTVWRAGHVVVRAGRHIARETIAPRFEASLKRMAEG